MSFVTLPPIERHFAVQSFLHHEAHLLDSRQFEAWRDLFTEDGRYWVPLKPCQKHEDADASLFDDDRTMMATRFERLRHPNIHSQTPHHRTCHVIGNVTIQHISANDGIIVVASTMIMTDYRLRTTRMFSGHVTHRLREENGSFRIVLKGVELINCDDAFELIAVPL